MFSEKWDVIYGNGEQLNEYPYNEVVSFFKRYKDQLSGKNALDVGCGSGVHAVMLAKYGLSVTAFDASRVAVDYAIDKYQTYKNLRFIRSTTTDFNADVMYDLVIDRLCTSQTGIFATKAFYESLYTKLNGGAYLFWQGFCSDNSGKKFAKTHNKEFGYWDEFTDGKFKNIGATTFYSDENISDIFSKYDIVEKYVYSMKNQINNYDHNYWQLVLKRPGIL
jgi:SAM-dependent methyltransferase